MIELKEAVHEAVRCHFEEAAQSHLIRLHVVEEEVVTGK